LPAFALASRVDAGNGSDVAQAAGLDVGARWPWGVEHAPAHWCHIIAASGMEAMTTRRHRALPGLFRSKADPGGLLRTMADSSDRFQVYQPLGRKPFFCHPC